MARLFGFTDAEAMDGAPIERYLRAIHPEDRPRVETKITQFVSAKKKVIQGQPVRSHISTSYIERQNLTLRMHCRRLTRLTNAFSKKLENFKAAIGLHFAYYNFVKIHRRSA